MAARLVGIANTRKDKEAILGCGVGVERELPAGGDANENGREARRSRLVPKEDNSLKIGTLGKPVLK